MVVKSPLPASLRALGIERTLRPGETLFGIGSRAIGVYEVLRGQVRLVRSGRAGNRVTLAIVSAGQVLAEASISSNTYNCEAIAKTAATVRLYPMAPLLTELDRDPKLARHFIDVLAQEVMSLRTRLHLRSIHNARDRVRAYLMLNAGEDGRTVLLPSTVKDLAVYLGLTHEALYRTLADMQADGEIKRSTGKIMLSRGAITSRSRRGSAANGPRCVHPG